LTSFDLKGFKPGLAISDNVVNNALIPAIEKACKPHAYELSDRLAVLRCAGEESARYIKLHV
jgi:hypothetical protein